MKHGHEGDDRQLNGGYHATPARRSEVYPNSKDAGRLRTPSPEPTIENSVLKSHGGACSPKRKREHRAVGMAGKSRLRMD